MSLGLGALLLVIATSAAASVPISGQVYDPTSGQPARGVSLELVYDDEDTIGPGQPVPAGEVGSGHVTYVVGADGRYRFEVPDGRRYRIEVNTGSSAYAAPSALVPPLPGMAQPGPVVPEARPTGSSRRYFLRFDVPVGDESGITNNHIAVDALNQTVSVHSQVTPPQAGPGDVLAYTVTVRNGSARDLSASAGRPAYVLVSMARGVTYLSGKALARVRTGDQTITLRAGTGFQDGVLPVGSRRLVRFGPFDLAAGAEIMLVYQASLSAQVRPGRLENRAAVMDAGGVELSMPSSVAVRVSGDGSLSSGVILGQVFCDGDGNGRREPDEAGVMGARVYMDTGSYAVTGPAGRYHLSQVRAGNRVIKLDEGTLAGGRAAGRVTRVVQLGAGVLQRADFAVGCVHQTVRLVGGPPGSADGAAAPRALTVAGDLADLQLSVDGRAVELPAATASLVAPDGVRGGSERDLVSVPAGGYQGSQPGWALGWRAPAGTEVARWKLVLGRLADDGVITPVRTLAGAGSLPAQVAWDGLDDSGEPAMAGAVHVAQLVVTGDRGQIQAASARRPFGIGASGTPGEPVVEVWRGRLFAGTAARPRATGRLERRIAALVARLGPADTLEIESHADGTGDRISTVARTQREAELVAAKLVAAGIAAERISSRGRGSLAPEARGTSPAARRRNRRVWVTVTPAPGPGTGIPEVVRTPAEVRVDGQPLELDQETFRQRIEIPASGAVVVVELQDALGRRAALAIPAGSAGDAAGAAGGAADIAAPIAPTAGPAPGASPGPGTESRPAVRIQGDLASGTLRIGDTDLPAAFFAVDTLLLGATPAAVPNVATVVRGGQRALAAPLVIASGVPQGLSIAGWKLQITDGDTLVFERGGKGLPPATLSWDGAVSDLGLVLAPGRRYGYRLILVAGEGAEVMSPMRWLTVDRDAPVELRGSLFTDRGRPAPVLEQALANLAVRAQGSPGERYAISVREVVPQGVSVVEERMARSARRAALARRLSALGVDAGRVRIQVSAGAQDQDVLIIAPSGGSEVLAPPEPRAGVSIDGVAQEVAGTTWRAAVAPGEEITLDVTSTNGQRVLWRLRAPGEPEHAGAHAQTAPARADGTGRQAGTHDQEVEQVAGQGPVLATVELPPAGVVLGSTELVIRGQAEPGVRIFAGAGAGAVHELVVRAGRFAEAISLPEGSSEVMLRAVDARGRQAVIRRAVSVAERRMFVLAMADAAVAGAYARNPLGAGFSAAGVLVDGATDTTTLSVGPVLLHGHVATYVKGRLTGGVFDALGDGVTITAHVDTAKEPGSGAFFDDLTDTHRDAPVFGDDGAEVRDAAARGRLFLQATSGESRALVGSIRGQVAGGELFRYDRTLDGATVRVVKPLDGVKAEVGGFVGSASQDLARAVDWYRATGGSLYYLRHGYVVEGSERVRVIVRDGQSGLPLSERVLVRGRDYTLDDDSGRMLLRVPLSSATEGPWVVDSLDASATPLAGNPVFLEVSYEHRDIAATGQRAFGAYVRTAVAGLSAGAGVVTETRANAPDHRLWGMDAVVKLGAGSQLTAELAGSRQSGASAALSMDGGLAFSTLGAPVQPAERTHLGWKLGASVHGGDLGDSELAERTRAGFTVQGVDGGFAGDRAVLDRGRLTASAEVSHQLGERSRLVLRHDTQIAELPQVGPTQGDIDAAGDAAGLHRRTAARTVLQAQVGRGPWLHRLEGMHQHVSSSARLADSSAAVATQRVGIGGATAYTLSPQLTLRVGHSVLVGLGDADPRLMPLAGDATAGSAAARDSEPLSGVTTNLGADMRLTSDLMIGADWYLRWNGDNAGQIGLRSALSETGSVYVTQRASSSLGGPDGVSTTTVIGAEDRIAGTAGGRTYGEYQLEDGGLGMRARAVLGLGNRWRVTPALGVAAGVEHQQALGGVLSDGTAAGRSQRNVLHGSLEYTVPERLAVVAQVELRLDDGGVGHGLARHDGRPGVAPGTYADHGGLVPGAPLVLSEGLTRQLLLGLGGTWRWAEDHAWLGRVRSAHTAGEVDGLELSLARYVEATAGWAYRPLAHDWLSLLARYSYLLDERPYAGGVPMAQALDAGRPGSRSHVLAVLPLVDGLPEGLPPVLRKLELAGKLAWKRTVAEQALGQERMTARTDALLWLVRVGYGFHGRWDASVGVRGLHLWRPAAGAAGHTGERRLGALFELGYSFERHLRLAGGYNMSRFSDDELGDLTRDAHGWFLRATGHY